MRQLLNTMIMVAAMLATIAVTYAFAGDTMQACVQADGSVLYTNKDVKGCKTVVGPELSIVPSYDKHPHAPVTLAPIEVPPLTNSAATTLDAEVVAKTCALYFEWVQINEKYQGGLRDNTIDKQQRRVMLTMIFGSGFSPSMCKP